VSSELVEVIERDLREVVESEIRKFIERYEDCEHVDAIYRCWGFKVTKFDVIIHGLPCDVNRSYIIRDTVIDEISDITCYIKYDSGYKDYELGWVEVAKIGNKCFIDTHINKERIKDIAKRIAKEMTKEAKKEQ
jgi:hypothetical protein